MASIFLSRRERQAWLDELDRTDRVLLDFARQLEDICEQALEQTKRELPAEHAAAMLLRLVSESEPAEDERFAA